MDLELSGDDYELLKQVLQRYVSNLRMEIAGTENAAWRHEMHGDEDRAKHLLERLEQARASPHDTTAMLITVRGFVLPS